MFGKDRKEDQVNNASSVFIFIINLLIIQGCQSGSVGQLVSWSGWSDWSDGLGVPGGPGGPGWVLKGPKSTGFYRVKGVVVASAIRIFRCASIS